MKRTFRNVTGDAEFHNPKNWDPEGEPVSGDELTFKPGWAEKVRDCSGRALTYYGRGGVVVQEPDKP